MPKVQFNTYKKPSKVKLLPSDLEVVVAQFGPFLDVPALMLCLHKHRDFVYNLLRSGELPSSKAGRTGYLVSATDLVQYLNGRKTGTTNK